MSYSKIKMTDKKNNIMCDGKKYLVNIITSSPTHEKDSELLFLTKTGIFQR